MPIEQQEHGFFAACKFNRVTRFRLNDLPRLQPRCTPGFLGSGIRARKGPLFFEDLPRIFSQVTVECEPREYTPGEVSKTDSLTTNSLAVDFTELPAARSINITGEN